MTVVLMLLIYTHTHISYRSSVFLVLTFISLFFLHTISIEIDCSSSILPTERLPASIQLIQNVILTTQIAANAAAASANAIASAVAASTGLAGGLHCPLTSNASQRLTRRAPTGHIGANQIGPALAAANAVAMATGAATAAAAAAGAVMAATGQSTTSGGGVGIFNADTKNLFGTGLVPNYGSKSDVPMVSPIFPDFFNRSMLLLIFKVYFRCTVYYFIHLFFLKI